MCIKQGIPGTDECSGMGYRVRHIRKSKKMDMVSYLVIKWP